MSNYDQIQIKLQRFIKKYYTNELIKGVILFFAIGFVYFFITLFIEHFLWLKPFWRTILFGLFILVELALLIFYIIIPCAKIWGFKNGINQFDAAKIIGNQFPEVSDKLLNMIQLKNNLGDSELIEASIDQRSKDLKLIPFKRAVDFTKNKKYLKYALIPVVIWLLIFITGNVSLFNNSLNRVVHYKNQYEPPAPFSFKVLNQSFDVIEGESFSLNIHTEGAITPDDAKIVFNNENYYLQNNGFGEFQYTFSRVANSLDFYFVANNVQSKNYRLNVLKTPVINNFTMVLNYPKYTGKKNEVVKNTGNCIVPQGTNVTWQVETRQTDEVLFLLNSYKVEFKRATDNFFKYEKQIANSFSYKVTTSNKKLKNHEKLSFDIEVIKDEFPKIIISTNIDSISRGPAQFVGQVSDDYLVKKLELVYYDKSNSNNFKTQNLSIKKSSLTDFYYVFPDGLSLNKGVEYEFYFQVFDNDGVNGSKKTKSRKFSYYKKTDEEVSEEILKEQKASLSEVSKSLEKSKKENNDLNEFKNSIQKKAEVNWNDTKKLDEFIKRQNQYEEMFKKQTNQLEENLKEQSVDDNLKEKKEDLQKRIDESKKLAEQEKLLEELNKLSEKLEKDDLIEKLEEIAKKNKNKQQSLERILELTKRFYVEQKANQIAEKLSKLSKELDQFDDVEKEENKLNKQENVNKEFKNIEEDLKELDAENEKLKRPMDFPNDPDVSEEITNELEKALDELENSNTENAKKSQKSAAKKMKKMAESMEKSMSAMNGESLNENIEDLRIIVENLIEFSFKQENLMKRFSSSDNNNAEFPKNLKQQQVLKEYFEHIDDSIYMLSLRLVKMGGNIRTEVSNVHFNMDKSLANFSDNKFDQGVSNQHFVITSANILANQLSDLLESLMNASASMGKGEGSSSEFSLPDIIKKQEELSDKAEEGKKKGEKPGDKKGDKNDGKQGDGERGEGEGLNEDMNAELFEIYKQQSQLREMLKQVLGGGLVDGENGAKVIKEMEELENDLLDKGFSNDIIERMKDLSYELLKLDKARKEQGKENKRESKSNFQNFENRKIEELKLEIPSFNYNEILNRQSLPLRTIYKIKVQNYFNTVE